MRATFRWGFSDDHFILSGNPINFELGYARILGNGYGTGYPTGASSWGGNVTSASNANWPFNGEWEMGGAGFSAAGAGVTGPGAYVAMGASTISGTLGGATLHVIGTLTTYEGHADTLIAIFSSVPSATQVTCQLTGGPANVYDFSAATRIDGVWGISQPTFIWEDGNIDFVSGEVTAVSGS